MPMTPDNRNDGEEQEEDTDELPVINIDDDPENANWLRILAKRRQDAQAQEQQQQPQKPRQ